jgi:hypothetical protein
MIHVANTSVAGCGVVTGTAGVLGDIVCIMSCGAGVFGDVMRIMGCGAGVLGDVVRVMGCGAGVLGDVVRVMSCRAGVSAWTIIARRATVFRHATVIIATIMSAGRGSGRVAMAGMVIVARRATTMVAVGTVIATRVASRCSATTGTAVPSAIPAAGTVAATAAVAAATTSVAAAAAAAVAAATTSAVATATTTAAAATAAALRPAVRHRAALEAVSARTVKHDAAGSGGPLWRLAGDDDVDVLLLAGLCRRKRGSDVQHTWRCTRPPRLVLVLVEDLVCHVGLGKFGELLGLEAHGHDGAVR